MIDQDVEEVAGSRIAHGKTRVVFEEPEGDLPVMVQDGGLADPFEGGHEQGSPGLLF